MGVFQTLGVASGGLGQSGRVQSPVSEDSRDGAEVMGGALVSLQCSPDPVPISCQLCLLTAPHP